MKKFSLTFGLSIVLLPSVMATGIEKQTAKFNDLLLWLPLETDRHRTLWLCGK